MFTEKDIELINQEFEGLRLASLKRCANQTEYEKVLTAFNFANEAHKGVRRRSGEPYILHPISVAKIIVKEIGLGYKSIVAALLHDVVEDTEYTVEDLQRLFGDKIASLVDGLTKIKHIIDSTHVDENKENYETSIQAENFKRILLTLNDDVRVILIKLADRLHNVRTIKYMPEHKRAKILSETMYIFVPLAHRLGLYSLKSELENIWMEYCEPEDFQMIDKEVKQAIEEKGCAIDDFINPISESLNKIGLDFTITKRTKTNYSIWKKMKAKGVTFDQIYDIYAVRIVFKPIKGDNERGICWNIYSLITEIYKPSENRLRDWLSTPKQNGYEALHCTVMGPIGNWVEVQIRSKRMDDIAEKGVAAHWAYKKGKTNNENEMDRWFEVVREVLNNPDVNALEFLDKFHASLLIPEMYVFTPKGESKNISKGSTALDFAYSIHSKIGYRAIAAKVNLKLVPLSHILKNGDQIEIITSESHKPERKSLDFVTTNKAKNLIYESLKIEAKNSIKEGQTILEKRITELGVQLQARVINKLIIEYKANNKDELYSKIGTNIIDLKDLEKILKKNTENKFVKYWNLSFSKITGSPSQNEEKNPKTNISKKQKTEKHFILKENPIDKTLSYRVAECCNPIPGDPVMGFLEDNEVIIHKNNCQIATTLAAREGDKIIKAEWSKHSALSFLARVSIRGIDRIGLLNDLTRFITLDYSVNIRKIFVETHDGVFEGYIDLYVHSTDDLNKLITKIAKIKSIVNVKRDDINENK